MHAPNHPHSHHGAPLSVRVASTLLAAFLFVLAAAPVLSLGAAVVA